MHNRRSMANGIDKPLKIALFYGSYRTKRQGIRAVRFLENALSEKNCEVTTLDAKEIDLPLLDKMFKEYKNNDAPQNLAETAATIKVSDAFVFVCGEYNHSIQPGLKNLIDHFQLEYFFKPAAIVSYSAGRLAGVRNAVHMRSILGELGMVTCSTIWSVGRIGENISEEGSLENETLAKSANQMMKELIFYGRALQQARAAGDLPF